jgi:hypothetical protein
MVPNQNQLVPLWSLLEEERVAHQSVLEDLQQEWGFLKKNDTEALISMFRTKEDHLLRIQGIRQRMEKTFAELVKQWGEDEGLQTVFDLIPHLPPEQGKKMTNYKEFRSGIRQEIHMLNERNKRFIQESLDFIGGLVSLLTGSRSEEPHYARRGVKGSVPVSASWVSRKV